MRNAAGHYQQKTNFQKMDFINNLLDEKYDWGDNRIDQDEYEDLFAELIIDYLKKHTPETRQMLALCWNFDNPKKVIQWIVEQPDTDKGTSLLLYWKMAPDFSKQFVSREECENTHSWYLEDYDIIQTLELNYTTGLYTNQRYSFNPRSDSYQDGYDWTENLMNPSEYKAAIPQEMFTPLEGIALDTPSWGEGIPEDVQPTIERLAHLVDE